MSKPKIIFIKPNNSSFIRGDQEIFEKEYTVIPILLHQSKSKLTYGIGNLKLFFRLISFIFNRNVVFATWFADYHAAVMVLAARLTGKKSVIFIGGQEAVCYHELGKGVYRNKFRGSLVKFALRNTSLIIANHKSLIYHENYYYNQEHPHIDGIKHYVSGLTTPVEIIYNGINPEKFVRNAALQKQENLVLTVGTMSHEGDFYNKGFDLFIQVAAKLPAFEFVLIGMNKKYLDWAEEKYHYTAIRNLKIIPSYCPDDVLSASYNQAKIFVQASITEGMPNTLSEAMLLECVPVGSNINGIPDAIGDTGVIIRERSVDQLAEAIVKASKMDTASAARNRVIDMFSTPQRIKKINHLFKQLLK